MEAQSAQARTAAVLAGLPTDQWTVLGGAWDQRHIVVGPPGVFAIDSKDWAGPITVKANTVRHRGVRRDEVAESAEHAAAAMAALGIRPDLIQAVVCFDRDDALTAWVRDARICSTSNLDTVIRSRPYALTPDEVAAVARHLEARLHGVPAPPLPDGARAEVEPDRATARSRWWRRARRPAQSVGQDRGPVSQ